MLSKIHSFTKSKRNLEELLPHIWKKNQTVEMEQHEDAFLAAWSSLSDDALNAKEDEIGFVDHQPLIDFENEYNIPSTLRQVFVAAEQQWLNNVAQYRAEKKCFCYWSIQLCRSFKRTFTHMVRFYLKIAVLTILFSTAFLKISFSQGQKEYSELFKYSKWSFTAGPVFYDKAELTPQYGDLTFENKPMLGFNAGVLYDFYPERKWSFQTGLIVAKEPIYSVEYEIDKDDLYPSYTENLAGEAKMYALNTFSFPIILNLNLKTGKRAFARFIIGLKAMYFPSGKAEYTLAVSDEQLSDHREIFGLKLESPENSIQGSFIIGTGFSYTLKKALLKANIVYIMNFQNSISGEFQFANLFTSPDTRGYYDLSGNYLGLLFSVSLKKSKGK